MATLRFDGVNDYIKINPITTALNNIPNGATTIAVLMRVTAFAVDYDLVGLRGGDISGGYYHGLRLGGGGGGQNDYSDDNGLAFSVSTGPNALRPAGTGGNNFGIVGWDWPASNGTTRFHASGPIGSAESWGHDDAGGLNGGLQAGPGTSSGFFLIGNYDGAWFLGDIGLVGVWVGTRFTDANWTDLWVNKKTSDWWNHPAGQPNTLIELNTATPVDIGANPVGSITVSGPALTGADPTGWTFDGTGAAAATFTLATHNVTPLAWRT